MMEIDPRDEPGFSIDRPEFNPLSVTVIVPLALLILMLTYVADVVSTLDLPEFPDTTGLYKAFDHMAFGLFLLSEAGQIFLSGNRSLQLNRFLHQSPVMENEEILERLKPLVRTNMYFVPVGMLFIGVALATGAFCLYQHDLLEKGVVVVL